jgi:hypothetical protein
MDIAYVSALSALAGSVVGGLTSTKTYGDALVSSEPQLPELAHRPGAS